LHLEAILNLSSLISKLSIVRTPYNERNRKSLDVLYAPKNYRALQRLPIQGDYVEEELIQALHFTQTHHIVLIPCNRLVRIWTSGKRVPRWVRSAISRHRREVLAMMQRSETLVCPSPTLHEGWRSKFLDYTVCDMCSHLRQEIKAIDTRVPARRKVA
jgi:hypothetical protein